MKRKHIHEANVWAREDCEYELRKYLGNDFRDCVDALSQCMNVGGVVGSFAGAVDADGLQLLNDPGACLWLIRLSVEAGYLDQHCVETDRKYLKRLMRVMTKCKRASIAMGARA